MAEDKETLRIPDILGQAALDLQQRRAESREQTRRRKRVWKQKKARSKEAMTKTTPPATPTNPAGAGNPTEQAAAALQTIAEASRQKSERRAARTTEFATLLNARHEEDSHKDDEDHEALLAASREFSIVLREVHTPAVGTPASSRGSSRSSSPTAGLMSPRFLPFETHTAAAVASGGLLSPVAEDAEKPTAKRGKMTKLVLLVGSGVESGFPAWKVLDTDKLPSGFGLDEVKVSMVGDCVFLAGAEGLLPVATVRKTFFRGYKTVELPFNTKPVRFADEVVVSVQSHGSIVVVTTNAGAVYSIAYKGDGVLGEPELLDFPKPMAAVALQNVETFFGFAQEDLADPTVGAHMLFWPPSGTAAVTDAGGRSPGPVAAPFTLPKNKTSATVVSGNDRCLVMAKGKKGGHAAYHLIANKVGSMTYSKVSQLTSVECLIDHFCLSSHSMFTHARNLHP